MDLKNFDPLAHPGPLPSPCINICQMDETTGWCKGCQRTIDEIIDWSVAPEPKKRQIWLAINERRTAK
ncbi:COG3313 Predicted Fe-S protein [Oxalobacteraceae bacterium]|jgi:predicted Fe-S protein YdhL (DUF1289 family)